jgi:predicted esterase
VARAAPRRDRAGAAAARRGRAGRGRALSSQRLAAAGAVGEIHRFLAGGAAGLAADTLLVLHGTGGDENDLLPLARELAPGVNLLAPRGPVLERGMPRFFRRLGVGVFDLEDLARRTVELAAFVRAAADLYRFDARRVVALGYSNGANIAASLLLTDGAALAGAALLRAMLPFEPQRLPDLSGKPVYLAAGRRDPYASPAAAEALAEQLRAAGAVVELAWSDGAHGLEPDELYGLQRWLVGSAFRTPPPSSA